MMHRRNFLCGTLLGLSSFGSGSLLGNARKCCSSCGSVGGPGGPASEFAEELLNAARANQILVLESGECYTTNDGIVIRLPVKLCGKATLHVEQSGRPVLYVSAAVRHTEGVLIEGLRFSQPAAPVFRGGTSNNHFALKLSGVRRAVLSDLEFAGVRGAGADLGLHVGYGEGGMADRASTGVVADNIRGSGLRGIGFELFGSRGGDFRRLNFRGGGGGGAYGLMSGVRITSYDFAPNISNFVEARVARFRVGLSVQAHNFDNTVMFEAEDCDIGLHVHGRGESRDSRDVSRNNVFYLTAKGCRQAVYDGGSDNEFFVDVVGSRSHGILATGGRGEARLGTGNSYSGSIRQFVGRGAEIAGDNASVDLVIEGRGHEASAIGFSSKGIRLRGVVKAAHAETGVSLEGRGADLSVQVTDCRNALIVSGDANVVRCDIEGAVTVTGRGNHLFGRIRGPVHISGAENRNDATE